MDDCLKLKVTHTRYLCHVCIKTLNLFETEENLKLSVGQRFPLEQCEGTNKMFLYTVTTDICYKYVWTLKMCWLLEKSLYLNLFQQKTIIWSTFFICFNQELPLN